MKEFEYASAHVAQKAHLDAVIREAGRIKRHRDQLREALDFMVAQFGIHDCPAVRQARAALEEADNE